MADRLHALALNELSAVLSMYSRFVPLSEEEEIARRVVKVVQGESAAELVKLRSAVEQVRGDCESMVRDPRGDDVGEGIWRKGVYAQARRTLNILQRAMGGAS